MNDLVKNAYHPPPFSHPDGSHTLQSPHDGINTASYPFQMPFSMSTPQHAMPSAPHLPLFNPTPLHSIPFSPLNHIASAPHMFPHIYGSHTQQPHADTTSHDGTDTANAHENLINGAADAMVHSMLVQPLMHNSLSHSMPFNPTSLHPMMFNPTPQTYSMQYTPTFPQMQFQPQIQTELEPQHNSAVRKSPTMHKGNVFMGRRRANSDSKLLSKLQPQHNPAYMSESPDTPAKHLLNLELLPPLKTQPEHNSTLSSKIQPNLDLAQNNSDSSSKPLTPVSTHPLHSLLSNGSSPETHDSNSTIHGNNNNSTAPITEVPVLVAHDLASKTANATETHVPELNPGAAATSQSTNKTIAAHAPKYAPRRRASYQPTYQTTYPTYQPEQIGYVVIIKHA